MGWFNKKEAQGKRKEDDQISLPSLPKLPELPELPRLKEFGEEDKEPISKLPTFPGGNFGEKFSRDTIKDAVSGPQRQREINSFFPEEKKGDKVFEADEFVPLQKSVQMMQKPLFKPTQKEFEFQKKEEIKPSIDINVETEEEPEYKPYFEGRQAEKVDYTPSYSSSIKKDEPVFIRIDKFEESLKIFEKTKKEILEIEKALKDISDVREAEDKELEIWQNDILKIKEQIEKVDKDIFSKIE